MKCLPVTAHPLSNSLCKSLADYVAITLSEAGHEIVVEDLYAQDFQPALTSQERASYYKETYAGNAVTPQLQKLLAAEALILVFPTWWFGFPAILKGWFDRVWVPGAAYDHADNYGPIKPRLDKLKYVLAITTLGSPCWVDRFIMWQPVRRILKLALLGTCTTSCRLDFLSLYKSEKVSESAVTKFRARIAAALGKWRTSK